ncbi:helicase-related protein [Synechocystis sp. PCC 7509]|uniref:helicase-related protein n=1 Tax=Synechocystis sp. PCC 7509 TaxID=927677 RepID=UPI0002ABB67C|nr:helicase-related protein [Synechocystis sp. PCC 7509]
MQCDKEQRVLCVDLSVFFIKSIRDLLDVDSVEVIKDILSREINYLKSKSIFANLGLDTKIGLNLSPDLAHYFSAFKREDKESVKLIQAASYTHSFYEFMRSHNLTTDDNTLTFNVVGYSDRAINAMSLNLDNLRVLETCSTIYKQKLSDIQINDARKKVLKLIQRNTAKSFNEGKEFIAKLLNVPAGITTVTHTERIEGFLNSQGKIPQKHAEQLHISPELTLRDAHAELIKQALMSEDVYIFLTGNPGIGKTTAIANVLKTPTYSDEGFLFFYASPRTQVNLDIIEKFTDEDTQTLFNDKFLTITTNSDLIKKHGGRCTVNYLSDTRDTDFIEKTVHFINQNNPTQEDTNPKKKLAITSEDTIQCREQKNRGVLDSICEAIYTVIESNISTNILATVSIQSLKKTRGGKDTLEHFEKIFKSAYNEREGKVIPAKMQGISRQIKHLFIMIDEITGDDSGVEFLSRIGELINKYKLTDPQHGFNVKVIVADASIVNSSIIEQHLKSSSVEPNKIFFRQGIENCPPIAKDSFNFNNFPASVINTNSYPAKSLTITYKVIIESCKYVQTAEIDKGNGLRSRLQQQLIDDIYKLLASPDFEQIIVYIQDKQRLAELIEKIRKDKGIFQYQQDYIEIHADLSEQKKQEIKQYQNSVKIVFMTASASRGLSFPKTKYILVDAPRFEVEKNLMEIIQVIYRGRGSYLENGVKQTLDNTDKELIFYFSERSVYYEDPKLSTEDFATQRQLSLQESVLSVLNILLVLKTSIMTRITGFGQIGKNNFIMIPIGGKSVTAAGQTFSSTMSSLINKLKKESSKQQFNQQLKEVYSTLKNLLNRSEIVLKNPESFTDEQVSYLSLRESLANKFIKSINKNFAELLDFKAIEVGYVSGSLLVIPLAGRLIEEKYEMRMEQEILKYANNDFLKKMYDIKRAPSSTESLKYAIDEAIELVKLLRDQSDKTQRLEQYSQRLDRYYALPLFTFLSSEEIKKYLANAEETEDKGFKKILTQYLQTLYPIGNILPIGNKYSDFPFIVFTSYSLNEMRNKIFTNNYLISSNELNVLNLILATDE